MSDSTALSRRGVGLAVLVLAALALAAFAAGLPDQLSWAIQNGQRSFHHLLVSAMQAIKAQGLAAGGGLIAASFAYGVFHAAGPGHGKLVISTYLATNDANLRRGIALSTVAALVQALTAVVAVGAVVWLLGASNRTAQTAAMALEQSSYGLVALFGAVLSFAAGRRLLGRLRRHAGDASDGHLDHDDHHHGHQACAHGPDAASLAGTRSLRQMVALVLAVGLRPCSGAILVLVFAEAAGLRLAGIAAVFAMAAGTAVTVASLAALAVHARRLALRLGAAAPEGGGRLGLWLDGVALAGGLAIMGFGVILFQAARVIAAHPLL